MNAALLPRAKVERQQRHGRVVIVDISPATQLVDHLAGNFDWLIF